MNKAVRRNNNGIRETIESGILLHKKSHHLKTGFQVPYPTHITIKVFPFHNLLCRLIVYDTKCTYQLDSDICLTIVFCNRELLF